MKHIITLFLSVISLVFCAQGQSLVSMTPSTGAVGTTVTVTIKGNSTAFTSSTNFVLSLGTGIIPLSDVVALNATSATAKVTIPANAASGAYSLLAIAGLGLPLQLANAFTVKGGAPVAGLVSISPGSANQGESLMVTITGVNTSFTQSTNTTVALTTLGGGTPIVAPIAIVQSDTKFKTLISVPADAATGQYILVVNTSNDGTLVLPNAFTVNGTSGNTPEITSISPTTGKRGQTLNVSITGANTRFMQGSDLTVSLFSAGSPLTANYAFANSNTSITANFTIPANQTLGLHDLYVLSAADGLLTFPAGFTVTGSGSGQAEIVAVNPPYGSAGQTLDVTITGLNTHFAQGSSSLAIYSPNQTDGVEATSVHAISETEVTGTFTIPSTWINGLYTVGIMTDIDGILEMPSSFSIVSTGVRELTNRKSEALSIWPNPVSTRLTFESVNKIYTIVITDLAGRMVEVDKDMVEQTDSRTYSFNLSTTGIKKGIYFLKVETDQGSLYQKFIAE